MCKRAGAHWRYRARALVGPNPTLELDTCGMGPPHVVLKSELGCLSFAGMRHGLGWRYAAWASSTELEMGEAGTGHGWSAVGRELETRWAFPVAWAAPRRTFFFVVGFFFLMPQTRNFDLHFSSLFLQMLSDHVF